MSNVFKKKNEEIFSDQRQLDIDYIYENNIQYGPTMIDTLTFSFKNFQDQEIISLIQCFGFDFQPLKDGDSFISKGGYDRIYICQRTHSLLKCSWTRASHAEVSVLSLTGSACGMLYSEGKMFTFLLSLYNSVKAFGLFSELYTGDRSFKCSRIDLCKDNFTDYFEKLAKDNYGDLSRLFYSQSLSISPNCRFINGNLVGGWTLYFGLRQNSTFIRIYDKRTEQKISDEKLPFWTRLEFEIKNNNGFDQANKIFNSLVSGEDINDIFFKICDSKFFFLNKPWSSDSVPHRDEVGMDREFKKFISERWDNSEQNLCFAKCLRFLDKKKSDETVKRLVSALVPKVFYGKTIKEIIYMLEDLIYPDDKKFRIDNKKNCIYVYYRSSSGDILNDIPCLPLDVPSESWGDLSDIARSDHIQLDEFLYIVSQVNEDFYSKNFDFSFNSEVSTL